jgi:hypothetical protein
MKIISSAFLFIVLLALSKGTDFTNMGEESYPSDDFMDSGLGFDAESEPAPSPQNEGGIEFGGESEED